LKGNSSIIIIIIIIIIMINGTASSSARAIGLADGSWPFVPPSMASYAAQPLKGERHRPCHRPNH
jgi:hypothetical protein